jgi:hypothetical protein
MVSYAVHWTALKSLAGEARWANLGAGAGLRPDPGGLESFKRGWATGTRTAYFCGRVLDQAGYARVCAEHGCSGGAYFPGYRSGEFT